MRLDLSCPVEVRGYAISAGGGVVRASVRLHNLARRQVASIEGAAGWFSTASDRRLAMPFCVERLRACGGHGFRIALETALLPEADRLELCFSRVRFADGGEWRAGAGPFAEMQPLPPIVPGELAALRELAGGDAVCYPKQTSKLWRCVCGRLNPNDEDRCARCRRDHIAALACTPEAVRRLGLRAGVPRTGRIAADRRQAARVEDIRDWRARKGGAAEGQGARHTEGVFDVGMPAGVRELRGSGECGAQRDGGAVESEKPAERSGFSDMGARRGGECAQELDVCVAGKQWNAVSGAGEGEASLAGLRGMGDDACAAAQKRAGTGARRDGEARTAGEADRAPVARTDVRSVLESAAESAGRCEAAKARLRTGADVEGIWKSPIAGAAVQERGGQSRGVAGACETGEGKEKRAASEGEKSREGAGSARSGARGDGGAWKVGEGQKRRRAKDLPGARDNLREPPLDDAELAAVYAKYLRERTRLLWRTAVAAVVILALSVLWALSAGPDAGEDAESAGGRALPAAISVNWRKDAR